MSDSRDHAERAARILAPQLAAQLRRRYRMLASDHDDLVQEVLENFVRFLDSHAGRLPPEEEWAAIASTMLKRRIADRFRRSLREVSRSIDETDDDAAEVADTAAPVDEVVRYRRLLSAVLGLLAEMSDADRALLLDEAMPEEAREPMSASDRKRLSRLRDRLREGLRLRFGVAPDDYFGR